MKSRQKALYEYCANSSELKNGSRDKKRPCSHLCTKLFLSIGKKSFLFLVQIKGDINNDKKRRDDIKF